MRTTAVTLLSAAAAFSLCAFARPPHQTAAISTPLAKRYVSGWCGTHVVQYQQNEGPSGSDGNNYDYRLDVTLYDALQDPIGGATLISAPGGVEQDIDSQLPFVFEAVVGANDGQSMDFAYNGQSWSSTDTQCSQGAFSGGSRNIDCGFTC